MFGLLEKVGKTVWDISNIPVDIVRDVITEEEDSWVDEDLNEIDKNLEKIFTGDWDDDK